MNFYRRGQTAFLDEVRWKRGNASLIESFRNTMEADRKQAVKHLNDDNLCFPSLYVLREEISRSGLSEELSERYRVATELLMMRSDQSDIQNDIQKVHPTLKWMIKTGGEENIDNAYLKKLDKAAGLMTTVYRDRSILPGIADMIFFRCRNELPYHDLVWAFLEIREPYSLALIADRLRSSNANEAECARRLLTFIPGIERTETGQGERQFRKFCEWLEENGPYLKYKGETFDTTHHPTPYTPVWRTKYLGAFVAPNNGGLLVSLTKKEKRLLRRFDDLLEDEQRLLAAYSARKRRLNHGEWLQWTNLSIKKQLKEAEGENGHD
ncbi:MAG TPA: hypothetical protein VFT51_08450 [Bacillales bacterium]|nr:hypothetical protein [Bacillales bacterium]